MSAHSHLSSISWHKCLFLMTVLHFSSYISASTTDQHPTLSQKVFDPAEQSSSGPSPFESPSEGAVFVINSFRRVRQLGFLLSYFLSVPVHDTCSVLPGQKVEIR